MPSTPNPRAPRWTADTEIAFLMALRVTGSPTGACAAIGRGPQGTYKRRRQLPAFAAAWDKVLDELTRTGAAAAVEERGSLSTRRARAEGFSPLRRRAFLQALAETGRYDKACARVRISVPAATKLRRRDPAFAALCEEAVVRSMPFLTEIVEQAAVARAVEGVEEPIFQGGQKIGTRRVYSDSLLRLILQRLDQRAGTALTLPEREARAKEAAYVAGGQFVHPSTQEETDRALLRSIQKSERKLFGRSTPGDTWEEFTAARAANPLPPSREEDTGEG